MCPSTNSFFPFSPFPASLRLSFHIIVPLINPKVLSDHPALYFCFYNILLVSLAS